MTETSTQQHRISWYVWAWDSQGNRERMRHTATMRGRWGWDAECSCGWKTQTGGATRRYVGDEVWFHNHIDSDGPRRPTAYEKRYGATV